jgi:hypothetical protein
LSCTFSHCLAFFKNFSHLLAYHGSSRINLGQEEEGCGTGGADTKLMTYWLEGAPTRPRRYWTQSTIVVVVITAAVTRAEEWNCSDRECVQGWTKWSFLKLILKLVPEGLILFKRDQLFWFWISHVFEIWIAVFLFDLPWSFLEKPPALDGQTMLNSSTSTLHSLQGRPMTSLQTPFFCVIRNVREANQDCKNCSSGSVNTLDHVTQACSSTDGEGTRKYTQVTINSVWKLWAS